MTDPVICPIPTSQIRPSPYQTRRAFSAASLQELAKSIERDGLIEPVVVRETLGGWELIAGERRVRAVREYGAADEILARVIDVNDLQARRMCAAENLQREDLSAVEQVEALVEIIDAELIEDKEYAALGGEPKVRVRRVLTCLKNASEGNGKEQQTTETQRKRGKFAPLVQAVLSGLPKPIDWETFYRHDLPLVTIMDKDVRDVAISNKLNKSQTRALNDLKNRDADAYQRLTGERDEDGVVNVPDSLGLEGDSNGGLALNDLSAREIRQQAAPDLLERPMASERPAPPLPEGKWNLIYADPPWRYDFSLDSSDEIENHYPTMAAEEIGALPVSSIAADDCVLFMWATSPKLPEALSAMAAWGFRYVTSMVWSKSGLGLGYYARINHELLLIGVKGSPGVPLPENRPVSILEAPKGKHSEKPEEFRAVIECMYPAAKRIELFRRGSVLPGWDVWGNEAENDPQFRGEFELEPEGGA